MALVTFNCPNCHGNTEIDDRGKIAICPYCDSKILLDRPAEDTPAVTPWPPNFLPTHPPPASLARKIFNHLKSGCIVIIAGFLLLFIIGIIAVLFQGDEPAPVTEYTDDSAISARD